MKYLFALPMLAAAAIAAPAYSATIVSNFDIDAEGWRYGSYQTGGLRAATYNQPLGRIEATRNTVNGGFMAPTTYLGDKSEFVGGSFSFEFSSSVVADNVRGKRPLLVLTGNNGKTIFSNWGPTPDDTLQEFAIGLSAASFYRGAPNEASETNPFVTDEEFAAIMADLELLEIYGSWTSGVAQIALDNVSMSSIAVPEPATWAMMIGGFGLIGGAMRRRAAVRVSFG